ncbi:Uncharacterized protein FKW44_013660, partial [Caligus rogercresseyi]
TVPPKDEGSEALALALANRSAAFFEQGSFIESLKDVEAALYFDFPSSKRLKLYDRQIKILIKIGSKTLAKETYGKALRHIQSNGGTLPETLLEDIDSLVDDEKTLNDPEDAVSTHVAYDEFKGRHVVSDIEIPAGELVLEEDPIVSYLNPKFHSTNCSNCFRTLGITSFQDSKLHDFWKARSVLGEDATLNIYLALKAIQRYDSHFFHSQSNHLLSSSNYLYASEENQDFCRYTKDHQYETLFSLMDHPEERDPEEESRIYARVTLCIRLLKDYGYLKGNEPYEKVSDSE